MTIKSNLIESMSENSAPLLSHLVELRKRLLISVAVILPLFGIAYLFSEDIYGWLVAPLAEIAASEQNGNERRMIYTGLTEAFFTYIKISFWAAIMLSFPIWGWQCYRFIAPGLYKNERRAILPFMFAAPMLFIFGVMLAYYVVVPLAWKFFLGFETESIAGSLPIQLEARVSEYLSLSMQLLFGFGIAMQLPILLLLLIRTGVLTTEKLRLWRKYAIIVSLVMAAILTPPDIISQIILAIPLLLLYEMVILFGGKLAKSNES